MRHLILALLLIHLAGCASSGSRSVYLDNLEQHLVVGTTTTQEVLSLMGPPTSRFTTVTTTGTRDTWVYAHSQIATSPATFIPIVGLFAGGATVDTKSVGLSFDTNGRLASISHQQHHTDSGMMGGTQSTTHTTGTTTP